MPGSQRETYTRTKSVKISRRDVGVSTHLEGASIVIIIGHVLSRVSCPC